MSTLRLCSVTLWCAHSIMLLNVVVCSVTTKWQPCTEKQRFTLNTAQSEIHQPWHTCYLFICTMNILWNLWLVWNVCSTHTHTHSSPPLLLYIHVNESWSSHVLPPQHILWTVWTWRDTSPTLWVTKGTPGSACMARSTRRSSSRPLSRTIATSSSITASPFKGLRPSSVPACLSPA